MRVCPESHGKVCFSFQVLTLESCTLLLQDTGGVLTQRTLPLPWVSKRLPFRCWVPRDPGEARCSVRHGPVAGQSR